jgi:hypothetical protein
MLSVHPEADLAVIKLKSDGREIVEPFRGIDDITGIGDDYCAYGYPEDSIGPNAGEPTARLFRGYSQRSMPYQSNLGYEYAAIELSFPCPGGLSGGPIFSIRRPQHLVGLVTENVETTTLLDSTEILSKEGQLITEHYRRVINYGVGLLLYPYKEWIDSLIPATSVT